MITAKNILTPPALRWGNEDMNTRHIVLTKQDGAISLYIDGKLEDLKDGTEISVWTFDPAAIEESRSRFKEEVVKALEGRMGFSSAEMFLQDGELKFENIKDYPMYDQAIREAIETIKKL